MTPDKKSDAKKTASILQNTVIRKSLIYGVILLAVFLLGLIPMWLTAHQSASELALTQNKLKIAQIQNRLASAAIDARRGDYEPARQSASDFFTVLRAEADLAENSALNQGQRENINALFAHRDEVITLLARNDPASAERLSDLHVLLRQILSNSQDQK
jgi:acyl-CoA synthetase (AMP-forming)/AMP-acid ligase II